MALARINQFLTFVELDSGLFTTKVVYILEQCRNFYLVLNNLLNEPKFEQFWLLYKLRIVLCISSVPAVKWSINFKTCWMVGPCLFMGNISISGKKIKNV